MITGGISLVSIRTIDSITKSSRSQILYVWNQTDKANLLSVYLTSPFFI